MNLVFEKLGQILAANEKWVVGIAGTHFRLSECPWPVTVTMLLGNRIVGSMANMLAGDFFEDIEFDCIWITNGAMAQTVRCQITGGGAGSDRVLGEVSVIDGGRQRTTAGLAFWGVGYTGPLAGNISNVQLWNPAASGKRVIIEQVAMGVFGVTAPAVTHSGFGPQLTTLLRNAASKLAGGANSVAEVRSQQNVASLRANQLFDVYHGIGQDMKIIRLSEPIVLVPGSGLIIDADPAQGLTANFEFYEESL